MNEYMVAVLVVILAVIIVPVIFILIKGKCQDIDFKRQVEGKIPERTFKGDVTQVNPEEEEKVDMFRESCDAELRMHRIQNVASPK